MVLTRVVASGVIEQMFGSQSVGVELLDREKDWVSGFEDDFGQVVDAHSPTDRLFEDEISDTHVLPDLSAIPTGPYLAVLLSSVDRARLNGFDLVRLIQAEHRQGAHRQARKQAAMVEMTYATPGDANSRATRMDEPCEFASDELRPALTWTRRNAEIQLGYAYDIVERLPGVFVLLDSGVIDMAKARVFVQGTSLCSRRSCPPSGRIAIGRSATLDHWTASGTYPQALHRSRPGRRGAPSRVCRRGPPPRYRTDRGLALPISICSTSDLPMPAPSGAG